MAVTLFEQMQALLACAVKELDALPDLNHVLSGAPPRRFIQPGGQVAHDDCCEDGGQLYVRVVQSHPYDTFPAKALREIPCPDPFATQVAVGVVRCVQGPDNQGRAPSAERLTSEARQMTCDQAALLRAIECCNDDDEPVALDRWVPLGPLGGCAGGEWFLWWHDPVRCAGAVA